MYDTICMIFWKRYNYRDRKTDQWLPGDGDGGRGWLLKGTRELSGVIEMFYISIVVVVVTWLCLSKLTELYSKKRVNFTLIYNSISLTLRKHSFTMSTHVKTIKLGQKTELCRSTVIWLNRSSLTSKYLSAPCTLSLH